MSASEGASTGSHSHLQVLHIPHHNCNAGPFRGFGDKVHFLAQVVFVATRAGAAATATGRVAAPHGRTLRYRASAGVGSRRRSGNRERKVDGKGGRHCGCDCSGVWCGAWIYRVWISLSEYVSSEVERRTEAKGSEQRLYVKGNGVGKCVIVRSDLGGG